MIFLQENIDFLFQCIFVRIMTMVLTLSAFVVVGLYFPVENLFVSDYNSVFYVMYYVYLCSVFCVFNSITSLIFLAARYLKVFGIFVSKYLRAFSVSKYLRAFSVSKYLRAFSVSIINTRHQNIKTEINECKFLYRTLRVKKNLV